MKYQYNQFRCILLSAFTSLIAACVSEPGQDDVQTSRAAVEADEGSGCAAVLGADDFDSGGAACPIGEECAYEACTTTEPPYCWGHCRPAPDRPYEEPPFGFDY